ncbi:MAG: DUF2169 domain-containing protein [Planctomycetota bacterium]|nr:DUF2169 domain-containing protein [Planctomycetota bacterium]
MRVRRQDGLELGWFATQLTPGELSAVFVVKATYRIGEHALELVEQDAAPVSGDVEAEEGRGGLTYATDFVPYKPKADVLLRAHAHAPGGNPARYVPVSFRVGSVEKRLLAVGDRAWKRGLLGTSPGEPTPFTAMPLTWERAFGGPDAPQNPAGVGIDTDAMPNVEWPDQLLQSPRDRVAAAAFGPISSAWEPRKGRMGTYRGRYLAERWPWYPEDLEWSHFSSAPEDQQVTGFLRGDEPLSFENMHPSGPLIATRLPGVRARCFATFSGEQMRPIDLSLDTLFADLDNEQVVLVWRGRTPARSLRLKELVEVFALLEPLGEDRSLAEYEALSRAASDEEVAAAEEDEAFAAADVELDATTEEASERLAQGGVDAAALENQQQEEAAAQREWLAQQGAAVEPTTPAAAQQGEEDPATPGAWSRQRVLEALASSGSLAGANLSGLDLHEVDFSGAALQGAVFDAANLKGAVFDGAVLDGADLSGSTPAGARFQGASINKTLFDDLPLDAVDFSGARGAEASFAGCRLDGASFDGAALPKADFSGAALAAASFRKAKLQAARFGEAVAPQIDCSDADLTGLHGGDACDFSGAVFKRAQLRGSNLSGAALDQANFDNATAHNVLFTEASLKAATLNRADLTRSVLDDANMNGASMLQANLLYCSMERVDLTSADARGANLYSSGLWQAKTTDAKLDQANLAGTVLGAEA